MDLEIEPRHRETPSSSGQRRRSGGSTLQLDTNWSRLLHYDIFGDDEIERRAAHARAANGLGDAVAGDPSLMTGFARMSAFFRRMWERHRERRQRKAIHNALSPLDDRTLRDLGITRDEIASLASEVTGGAERTRMRAVLFP